jgi:putative ABC transport system substrate-binding protein
MLKVVQTITLSAVFVAFGFRNTDAQQARIPKVGWLSARSSSEMGSKSFWREFKTLGYIDGRNVAFEYRYADDDPDRLPTLANELVQLKVNVLLTPSSRAALALQNAT